MKRAKPERMTCKTTVILDAMTKLGISQKAEMARAMGYSNSIITVWEKSGEAPMAACLAAECLVRRQGQGFVPVDKIQVVVLAVDTKQLAIIEPVLDGLKISYQKVL